jgi:hypothetical protein
LRAINVVVALLLVKVWLSRWSIGPWWFAWAKAILLCTFTTSIYMHTYLTPTELAYTFTVGVWSMGLKAGTCATA